MKRLGALPGRQPVTSPAPGEHTAQRHIAPAGAPLLALTERTLKGVRLAALTPAARDLGLALGMTLADARARLPELASQEIDRGADARALVALGRWAMRFSPTVALDGRDGLMIDATGCAHLWGGEAGMLAEISARLDQAGLTHRLGLAPTPAAARALAHAAPGQITRIAGASEAELAAGLADLPVTGLRLTEAARILLRRFGLVRLGQLLEIDRRALARRFQEGAGSRDSRAAQTLADQVVLRLDQALGRLAEPLAPIAVPPAQTVRLPCPDPLIDLTGLQAGLDQLLSRLSTQLASDGLGARRLTLRAFRADGTEAALTAQAARPARDPAHWARLFADRLAALDPGFGIDLLLLEASGTDPLDGTAPPPRLGRGQVAGLGGGGEDPQALAALADRIAARLGPEAVTVTAPEESHLPERGEQAHVYDGALPDWSAAGPGPWGARPLKLFERPEPAEVIAEVPDGPPVQVVWRRVVRRVVRAEGPERLGPEWWRTPQAGAADVGARPRARDCYRVEDAQGWRLWLCRDGLYGDGRGAPPRWYVHGLFQ